MKPMSVSVKRRPWRKIFAALILTSVSGCASSGAITGIEAPGSAVLGVKPRLSLCELIRRDLLQPSRRDTEETRDNLTEALIIYDANCPAGA